MTSDPVAVIGALFAREGLADYLGEPVTQGAHMLQTAALALRADAPPALVAAACCTRLSPGESARFEARPYAMNACQVRRRDDDAKNPDAPAPAFAEFEPLLRELVR